MSTATNGLAQQVMFAGHVDNVGDYLSVFDALVCRWPHQKLGSTLLEGMCVGVPIVTSEVMADSVHSLSTDVARRPTGSQVMTNDRPT